MKKYKPTDSELEILQILWDKDAATVREVHDILAETKEAGYTTTLKLMQIMHEKGLVIRDTASRSHVYRAALSQQATQELMVDRLIRVLFSGSSSSLVLQALGRHQTSPEELQAIRDYLHTLEKNKKNQ